MFEQRQFTAKELIWAKVGDYPWWPGRIINVLEQNHRNVYKVNFFADPTYCYLYPDALLPFSEKQPSLQETARWNSKLKKAFQLATACLNKNKQRVNKKKIIVETSLEIIQHHQCSLQQTLIESKENIEILQKNQVQDQTLKVYKQPLDDIISENVHQGNVLNLLHNNIVRKLQNFKGYNQRKRSLQYMEHLQENILSKYNLLNIPPKIAKPIHKVRKQKKIKRYQSQRTQSIKTLYKILKDKNINRYQCQGSSIKIVQKIEQICSGNIQDYRKCYISVIQWLKNADYEQIQNYEYAFFGIYYPLKKEDQEISKMTQLSEIQF